jgi:hypothetical protein
MIIILIEMTVFSDVTLCSIVDMAILFRDA